MLVATFLLTIGAFLLTIELLCLQSCALELFYSQFEVIYFRSKLLLAFEVLLLTV